MRRLAAILGLAALAACTTDIDQSTRPDNLAGTYHLASVGGNALPAPIMFDTFPARLVSGELVLTANGTWSETLAISTVSSTGVKQVFQLPAGGTWIILRDYAYIAFTDKVNAYSFSGVAAGNTVVLKSADGQELLYRR